MTENQKHDAPPRLESRSLWQALVFWMLGNHRTLKGAVFFGSRHKKNNRFGNRKKKYIHNYTEDAFNYIKQSRISIYAVIIVFFLSALASFIFFKDLGFIDIFLDKILKETENLNGLGLILYIFNNNLNSAFFGLFGGILLGVWSVLNASVNGAVLGYVLGKVYEVSGFLEFWRILPHGIFELPAIFISLGLGLRLGAVIFSGEIVKEFKLRFSNSVKVFFLVVVPLLILASIIESFLLILYK